MQGRENMVWVGGGEICMPGYASTTFHPLCHGKGFWGIGGVVLGDLLYLREVNFVGIELFSKTAWVVEDFCGFLNIGYFFGHMAIIKCYHSP